MEDLLPVQCSKVVQPMLKAVYDFSYCDKHITQLTWAMSLPVATYYYYYVFKCLQCPDAVGLAAGRASDL